MLNFKRIKDKVCIICPEHGEFIQCLQKHIYGQGCPKCAYKKRFLTTEEFINKSNIIHYNKYDYTKVKYENNKIKVEIICPIHGSFYMRPLNHLQGCGCPKCNISRLEGEIISFLNENSIIFEYQKRFDWLGKQSLDFYLPDYNIAIECQGIQHFKPVEYFGGREEYQKRLKLDINKKDKCIENNVKLLYYSNVKGDNIITDNNTLLKIIKGKI